MWDENLISGKVAVGWNYNLLADSMSSMFLIESAICKVPIVSILIGLKQESPFIFDRIGIYKSMMNEHDLYNELRSLLRGNSQTIPFEIEQNATDKVIVCIRKDIENEYVGN